MHVQYTDRNHEESTLHERSSKNCKTATAGNDDNVSGRMPHASMRTLVGQRLVLDVISAPRRENFSSRHNHTLLSFDIKISSDLKPDNQNYASQRPTHALRADFGVSCRRMRLTAAPHGTKCVPRPFPNLNFRPISFSTPNLNELQTCFGSYKILYTN